MEMRRLCTRASCRRLFLLVAAVSVISLAASGPINSAVRGSHVSRTVAAPPVATAGVAFSASSDCSEATARQLVAQHRLNRFLLRDPVRQVLCGPFAGPGSEAMAITIGAPTCWPIQNWAVFRINQGEWQLVLDQPAYLIPPLVAVGSDIRETTAVYRRGDPRCIPSGGTHARIWHWDGTRFVAGAWKQMKAADLVTRAEIYSPSRNVGCQMIDRGRGSSLVVCASYKPLHWVSLALDGRLKICPRGPRCTGNWGEDTHFRLLAYGKQITVGRFRCYSLRAGMRCIVIRSGKGFLINRVGITRVG